MYSSYPVSCPKFPETQGRAIAAVEKSMGISKQRLGRIWGLFLLPAAVTEKGN